MSESSSETRGERGVRRRELSILRFGISSELSRFRSDLDSGHSPTDSQRSVAFQITLNTSKAPEHQSQPHSHTNVFGKSSKACRRLLWASLEAGEKSAETAAETAVEPSVDFFHWNGLPPNIALARHARVSGTRRGGK